MSNKVLTLLQEDLSSQDLKSFIWLTIGCTDTVTATEQKRNVVVKRSSFISARYDYIFIKNTGF
jgi:hypothetical protein